MWWDWSGSYSSGGSYNLYVPAAAPGDTLLYLKDGSVLDVSDYWLEDGRIRYKTVDGVEGSFNVGQLDVPQTVNRNADRGIVFTLRAASVNNETAAPSDTLLYLKDGSVFDVTDFYLAKGRVEYKTVAGEESSFDIETLDLQQTVTQNADRGVAFTLEPAPEASPDAPPDSAAPPPD